jgi:hypothetical protein
MANCLIVRVLIKMRLEERRRQRFPTAEKSIDAFDGFA